MHSTTHFLKFCLILVCYMEWNSFGEFFRQIKIHHFENNLYVKLSPDYHCSHRKKMISCCYKVNKNICCSVGIKTWRCQCGMHFSKTCNFFRYCTANRLVIMNHESAQIY